MGNTRLKEWAVFLGRALVASAIAFTAARLTTWTWVSWYLDIQGIPPREKTPDPYLAFMAPLVFGGLFCVVLVLALGRMRGKDLPSKPRQEEVRLASDPIDRVTWYRQLSAFIGHGLVAFAIAYASAELTAFICVRWYAFDMGIPLHELSEDLGLGIITFMICVPVFAIVLIVVWVDLHLRWRARWLLRM